MAALQVGTVEAIKNNQAQLLSEWIQALEASGSTRNLKEQDLQQQAAEFLQLAVAGLEKGNGTSVAAAGWEESRQFLERLSSSRALLGHDSQQTASFIFALKGPLFSLLQRQYQTQPEALAQQLWEVSELFDSLGMHTIRTFQNSREAVI